MPLHSTVSLGLSLHEIWRSACSHYGQVSKLIEGQNSYCRVSYAYMPLHSTASLGLSLQEIWGNARGCYCYVTDLTEPRKICTRTYTHTHTHTHAGRRKEKERKKMQLVTYLQGKGLVILFQPRNQTPEPYPGSATNWPQGCSPGSVITPALQP